MGAVTWILVAVALLFIELITMGLTTIWFAGGALVAFLVSLLGFGLPLQLGVFMAVSVVLLVFTRPLAAKHLNDRTIRTNVETMPGRMAVVTQRIDNRKAAGQIQIEGVYWSARSADGSVLEPGTNVQVKEVQGVKAIVVPVKEGE